MNWKPRRRERISRIKMSLNQKDLDDTKLARPVAVVDLWTIDDRIDRLQDVVIRLEKVVEILVELYLKERVKNWEMILQKMLEKEQKKGNRNGNRTG
jgi:hypothetical protein